MHDRETGSLWPQPWGECFKGPSEGKKLSEYPAIHTTYAEFKKLYPHGQLLKKPEKGEAGSPYGDYFADSEKLGMFGRLNDYERMPGKDKVFGIRHEDKQVAISLALLKRRSYTLVTGVGDPMIVTYDSITETASAFAFRGDQRASVKGLRVYSDSINAPGGRTVWNPRTGKVIRGDGSDLPVVPIMSAYWFAWLSFFPNTELIK